MNLKSKLVFAALAAVLSIGAAYAQQPIVIKFSHVVAENTPKGKGALKFKELAEARTKGRVKVDVYANSTLYKDGEEMQMLQLGSVQMLAPSVSKFGPLGVRAFEVFDLPFIFDNDKDLHNVTQGRIGQQLFKMLESKGIVGLAYWDNGFKQMSSNKPLRTPADFRGQKIRIQSSKVLDGQMRALGATPQVMAFSEVYQALQTGVVDGQREHVVEYLHAEVLRGAEVHDRIRSRRDRICRNREQEILGRPACGHTRDARRRNEGCDHVRQRYRQAGERRGAGKNQGLGQVADHHAYAGREECLEKGGTEGAPRKREAPSARI